jgi:hypothetical protein
MLRSYFHTQIKKLEKRFGYDGTYMHEILDASPRAFWKFGLFQVMSSHRESISREAWYAARITAARHEDCGPCTQLVVDMALREGIEKSVLRAIVARDFSQMGPDAALGVRITDATLAHQPADDLRAEALKRFGQKGLISLAYAIASARVYPTVKRVLGHAHTCERVTVAGETVNATRPLTSVAA